MSLDPNLTRSNTKAEPTSYLPINANAEIVGGVSDDGVWTGNETYTTGVVPPIANGACDFDGVSYITFSNKDKFDFDRLNAMSLSLWFKTTMATNAVLITKKLSSTFIGWEFRLNNSIKPRFLLTNTNNTNEIDVASVMDSLNDGQWHHIVVTYDGSSNASGVNIYVDSVKDTSIAILDDTLTSTIINSEDVTIASRGDATGIFTGQMDNIAIWDFELTQENVTSLFNEGTGLTILE